MIRVYGRTNSNNVKKVLWCLGEIEEPFERIDAGGVHGLVDTPAFRALNPNGRVPVLDDDGFVLWESNAIVRYLAETRSAGLLCPSDPRVKAGADRWMDWCSTTLAPVFGPMFLGLVRTPPERRDAAAIEASRRQSADLLAMADDALGREPWLSGAEFGMGDIPLGCFAHVWFTLEIERPDLRNLAAWHGRLARRPAYREAVALPLS
jgi:glutathione S-transferase